MSDSIDRLEGTAQHKLIVSEAKNRGIRVQDYFDNEQYYSILSNDGIEHRVTQGIPDQWINTRATAYCDKKQLTKDLFNQLSINCPKSYLFQHPNDLSEELFSSDIRYVCKPEVSTNGIGVDMNISALEDVQHYWNLNKDLGPNFLLESFVQGDDLRVQVIGQKIVAACIRKPAFVIGNGKNTLQELIQQRQEIIRKQNPANKIIIDPPLLNLIEKQGVSLQSIVPENKEVRLREIANMGQGGVAIDCTDEISPKLQSWVTSIAEFLNTPYFALDLLSTDPLDIEQCTALELNLRAEWMHHTFSEKRTHDLAKIVVDELFPT